MRTIADIVKELAELRGKLERVEGTPTEVYSRIVGYYRSVRNWNKGKREEYGERKLFDLRSPSKAPRGIDSGTNGYSPLRLTAPGPAPIVGPSAGPQKDRNIASSSVRLILFVRRACPNCPSAKAAAEKLGFPLSFIDTDTEAGLEEARRWNVWSTPTAILLSAEGQEWARAQDAPSILAFKDLPFKDLPGNKPEQGSLAEFHHDTPGRSASPHSAPSNSALPLSVSPRLAESHPIERTANVSAHPSSQELDFEPVNVAI